MCFYLHSDHKNVKVAKKDIICYKILEKFYGRSMGQFKSPHLGFLYDFNKSTRYSVKKFGYFKMYMIYDGLHSYSNLKFLKEFKYSYSPFVVIFKCVIPKGTEYYYNPIDKVYVSLELEFKKRLTK